MNYWGTPDKLKQIGDGVERYVYKFGTRWNGLYGFVWFIPIPLVVPVGKDYIEFTIKDNVVVSALMKDQGSAELACMWLFPHMENGCHARNKIRHIESGTTDRFRTSREEMLIR
jgi:hypothetical protein